MRKRMASGGLLLSICPEGYRALHSQACSPEGLILLLNGQEQLILNLLASSISIA